MPELPTSDELARVEKSLVTHIGGVPHYHDDQNVAVEKALAFTFDWPIPALPELLAHGEDMPTYIRKPGHLACLREFGRRAEAEQLKIAKAQCFGLISCCMNGYDRDEAIRITSEHIYAMADAINVNTLILFSDEPSLVSMPFDFPLEATYSTWLDTVKEIGEATGTKIVPGIHSCGDITKPPRDRFDYLFKSDIKIINVNAVEYDITTHPLYDEFRGGGGRIAHGVNLGDGHRQDLYVRGKDERIENAKEQIKDFREGDLITPGCGMPPSFYSPRDCDAILDEILKLAKHYW